MFKEKIANAKYRNWVKAGLGLKYLREGLTDAVNDICERQHATFISNIYEEQGAASNGCDKCSLSTLLPLHYRNKRNKCPKGTSQKCNCMLGNDGQLCPTYFCSALYDKIMESHRFLSPNWNNTNIHEWYNNHWEIAKCYISADGYKHLSTHVDTDLPGLLSIILNNTEMQNGFDIPLTDVVHEMKDVRNQILHSAHMELDEFKLKQFVSCMADILGDTKRMTNIQDAQSALRKLLTLKHDGFIITTEKEAEVCRTALMALQEKETELRHVQMQWKSFPEFSSISGTNIVPDRLETEYLQKKKELQTFLVSQYSQYYVKTHTLHSVLEEENDIATLYVRPEMIAVYQGNEGKEREKMQAVVKSFRDIFYCGEKKNKAIYITGDAGVGKSTFCKHMVYTWCKTLHDDYAYGNSENKDDEKVLSEFDFVFFIPLRHMNGSGHVHSMITDVLPYGVDGKLLEEILDRYSDKCLIVLDGLDEWIPGNSYMHSRYRQMHNETIPQVGSVQNYTVITTTRPWKMGEVRLNKYECDVKIRMLGLSDESASIFVERMVSILNVEFHHDRHPSEFKKMMRCSHLVASLQNVPALLYLLVCLWYEGKPLGNSLCQIYSNMLELMLNLATAKRMPLKQTPEPNTPAQKLPTCFQTAVCCQAYKDILLKLGAIAWHSMFYEHVNTNTKQFSKREMMKFLTSEEMYWCLTTGVLTETVSERTSLLTHARSNVSFIHKSFQEFFAAVYLWTEKDFQTAKTQIPKCSPVRCIFDKNTFFVFVSGMNHFLGLYLLEELNDGAQCRCSKHGNKLLNTKIACHKEIEANRPL